MATQKLGVEKRETTGRKVKKLRREGILPSSIFGKGVKSLSVQIPLQDFLKVYRQAGETGIVEITVAGEKKTRPVLIKNVQFHPVKRTPLHVDLHQVDLSVKVRAMVPLIITNEAPAVREKIGALLTPAQEVEVEALPMDLPEKIAVDVSALSELDQEVKVKDLALDRNKITVLTDSELVVAKIGALISKEAEELAKEEAAKAAEAAAAAAPPAEERAPAPPAEGATAETAKPEATTAKTPQEEKKE